MTAVGFASTHKPTNSEQKIVQRANFDSYIFKQPEPEPKLVRNAEVEIVAPVLKRGPFKWRGIFEKRSISFELADEAFLARVMSKKVKFQNGTTLVCDLKMELRENEAGEIEPHAYVVRKVHKRYNKESMDTTEKAIFLTQGITFDQIQHIKEQLDDENNDPQFTL